MTEPEPMTERCTWREFQQSGLLWWINRSLHLFGWAIALEVGEDEQTILEAYPVRCKFRGFDTGCESQGFRRLTRHILKNSGRLLEDAARDDA
jgi:hypothetical protein